MSNEELVRVIMFLDPATDYNSYKYELYERRKQQWKFPKDIISSVQ